MLLNAVQIEDTINRLNEIANEQKEILEKSEKVICTDLAGCWECHAQKAYEDAFLCVAESVLKQINSLIELFGFAFKQCQEGIQQVDIDLEKMNVNGLKVPG